MSDQLLAFLVSEEAVATFQSGWLKADREGRKGERTMAGLEAVAERAREIA